MISGVNELYHLKHSDPAKALDQTCKQFESIFAYQLLKVMGDTVPEGGIFEKGLASDIYKDMLFQNVGQTIAESGTLGIGRTLKKHVQSLDARQVNLSGNTQNR